MKFADAANRGKKSIPGRPVLWRRMAVPAGYEAWGAAPADPKHALELNLETRTLRTKLRRA